ncbi:MlaA family lipoprotein [Caulobacter sp. KR2-114]|uniref:MlaA family lipoprotein n=1 Tax=Caulobacter sp. KR2-114 TaxID=3400912 RepID=UPI003BFC924D
MTAQRQPAAAPACLALSFELRRPARLLLTGTALSLALTFAAPSALAQDAHAPAVADQSIRHIDPWQKVNRFFFRIHNGLDKVLIRPAAMVYKALTPGPIGKAAHNFLTNISEPAILANDLLQFRFKRAGETSVRLVGNTLAGFGGLIDVAGKAGVPFHDNGFAITLGRYGVGPGPYMFVPLMGPTTVRDAIGTFADFSLDPIKLANYPHRLEVSAGLTVMQGLDLRSSADPQLKALFADATDPYATLRSAYLQNQQSQIDDRDDDKPAAPQFEDIPSEPAPGATPGAAGDAPATTPPPPPSADAGVTHAPFFAPQGPVIVVDPAATAQPVQLISAPSTVLALAQSETIAWR